MGYGRPDTEAMNQATKDGYNITSETVIGDQFVMRIMVTPDAAANADPKVLSAAIQAAEAFFNDGGKTTVWIDVQTNNMPPYVTTAIEGCAGFGVRIVLTWNGQCSLDNPNTIPTGTIAAIKAAGLKGKVWHPLKHAITIV